MTGRDFSEELVFARTVDGLYNEGVVIRPGTASPKKTGVVWVHGFSSNFYQYSTIGIGRLIAGSGYTFISGNNRGHDFGSLYYSGKGAPVLYGGGWERYEESALDIASWIDFTVKSGCERLVLIGHSLGALKVIGYQAETSDPRIAGIIAASPPLRGSGFEPEILAQAERLAVNGFDCDLLPWGSFFLGAGTLSARTFISFASRIGIEKMQRLIGMINCPMLAVYGTNEGWVGTEKELSIIAAASKLAETLMIGGADHSYNSRISEVSGVFIEWIGKTADNLK
jgi:pimeloyl-ACP methyl ester carboxylesterase